MRMDREKYYLTMAQLVAKRSTCTRLEVGAVLTNNNRVVGTGYNGGPKNTPHCIDIGCVHDENGRCATTIHAEVNAILSREGQTTMNDKLVMYCTHQPCRNCIKVMAQVGIGTVYYIHEYPDELRDELVINFKMNLHQVLL